MREKKQALCKIMADNIMELFTENKIEYNFFPVSSGSVEFEVKTSNDAHLALTTEPKESEPMIEVFLGGWKNTKSVIRKNKTKQVVIETPDIVNSGEFRGFWVRWDRGSIQAGREGEDTSLLSWEDPEPFPIAFVGVCTEWGATGTWKIEGLQPFNTPNKSQYIFQPVLAGSLEFEFCGPHNCHVALTPGPAEMDPMYEIMLGGWQNTKSAIRYCRKKPDKVTVATPGLLDPENFKKFLIEWRRGRLVVREGESSEVIMEWVDFTSFGISHFGVRTCWGASGQWRITHFNNPDAQPRPGNWIDARDGVVPPGAVVGGYEPNSDPMYVARAQHEGALIPGKLVASHGYTYIPWRGRVHAKVEYQVLVGVPDNWVRTNGSNVPPGAFPGGQTEDGETLYVGRVTLRGEITNGYVQRSRGFCYVCISGRELGFPDYEILVS